MTMLSEPVSGGQPFVLSNDSNSLTFLASLHSFFVCNNIKAYLVGGFVRDALLARFSKDIDIAICGDPFILGRGLADKLDGTLVPLDKKSRTARIGALTKDRERWQIDLTSLEGALLDDLARRDFTVDAMAVDLALYPFGNGVEPIDPFNGRADLKSRTVRATSSKVFSEDPGRLLRGPRLAAQLGFSLDPPTKAAIRQYAYLLSQVSPERSQEELCHILSFPGARASLNLLDELDLLTRLFPELASCKGVAQPKEHYWDVYGHSLDTVHQVERLLRITKDASELIEKYIPWDSSLEEYFSQEVAGEHSRSLILKLTGLLHDIGKPSTKSFELAGRMRFFGHSEAGAELARAALERLRFSAKEVKAVQNMVELHLRPSSLSQNGEMPTPRAIYRYQRDAGGVAIDTLFLSLADYLAAKGLAVDEGDWKEYASRIVYALRALTEEAEVERPPKLIDGNDLINEFGLSPGPTFKVLLQAVQEAQAEGLVHTKEEGLAFLAQRISALANSKERR